MSRPIALRPRDRRRPWATAACLAAMALPAAVPTAHAQAPAAPPQAAATPTLAVRGFRVEGNTLLPPARLDAVLAPRVGERSTAELQQAAAAVQALYAQAGYGGVVAFVPPQSPADGIVTVQVIEGRLARVQVEPAPRGGAARVRAALPALAEGTTPRLADIDAQVEMANENPGRQLNVLLQPGAAPGAIDARVTVDEQPLQRWTATLDNRGNERTGRWRASLGWQHADLTGRDDVLVVQGQTSPDEPDAVKVLSTSYRLPLYAQRVFIDAFAAYSDVDAGTTSTLAGALSFAGRGRLAGVRATKLLPRWGEVDQRLSLGLDYRAYLNTCEIENQAPGACGPAGESVSVQPLSLDYTLRRAGPVPFMLSLGLQHNLQLGGGRAGDGHFAAVRPGAKPRYTMLRAGGLVEWPIGEQWRLQLRGAGQWSPDALVPGEQFGVGGAASVRGYQERELAGDRGVQASLELTGPDWLGGGERALRPVLFADGAWVGNRRGTECRTGRDECTISAVGAGLRASAGRLQAQLFLAWALQDAVHTERHDTHAHLALSYAF